MAIYHFSGQVLGRSSGKNPDGSWRPGSKAVAAAAYRAGQKLEDHRHKQTHDYGSRRGVVHSEILTPPGSAPWLQDRELLWNTVEAMEERKDAQLAREFNMALPHELGQQERIDLVRDFVDIQFVRRGMVADFALHDPVKEEGQNEKNFHAHVMLTMRRATSSGLDPVKTREWNSKALLRLWRVEWEIACNRALARAGKRERIDHRTLQAQREQAVRDKDRERAAELRRQPEIHVGPRARQMVREGRQPRSQAREANAFRRDRNNPKREAHRRVINYPYFDRSTRLNFLERILTNNSERYRRDSEAINRRVDRLNRKADYWQRRATFHVEGLFTNRAQRFQRWQAAEAKKADRALAERRAAHARRRLAQLQRVLDVVQGVLAKTTRRQDLTLWRVREVEGWVRALRSHGRAPGRGRTRGRWRWREL